MRAWEIDVVLEKQWGENFWVVVLLVLSRPYNGEKSSLSRLYFPSFSSVKLFVLSPFLFSKKSLTFYFFPCMCENGWWSHLFFFLSVRPRAIVLLLSSSCVCPFFVVPILLRSQTNHKFVGRLTRSGEGFDKRIYFIIIRRKQLSQNTA